MSFAHAEPRNDMISSFLFPRRVDLLGWRGRKAEEEHVSVKELVVVASSSSSNYM